MWKAMVLIPKDKGEYRGIWLLETIWKVCTSIVNIRLRSSIVLHDVLHDFIKRKGTGTAIIEAKLEQQPWGIVHDLKQWIVNYPRELLLQFGLNDCCTCTPPLSEAV